METLRTIVQDIRRDLKQLKDDPDIPDAQLMYWTLVVADRLRMQHILKRRSGAFLTTFVRDVIADLIFINRRYIELPKSIYDIDLDGGIQSICYYLPTSEQPDFQLVEFFRTDPSTSRSRNMSEYQKARPDHPYFWREGSRIYLDGILPSVPKVEVKLLCNLPDLTEVDALGLADQPLDFPKELLYPLKRAVLDMGRFALSVPGEHLVNDGTNRNVQQVLGKPEKNVSVNDPLVNTEGA